MSGRFSILPYRSVRRDAVGDAIRADLRRVPVEDRHARVRHRIDDQRVQAEIATRHPLEDRRQRRHDGSHHDAGDRPAIDRVVAEQADHHQPDFVGRPLAQRQQPPAHDEPLAVEDAEDDVGVADVNR